MFPPELVRQIRLLELRTDHVVDEITGGAYRSIFKGRGIEFDEVREYTSDDDVRLIDWNVSARMGTPYVKKFVEERELTVMFLVDVSASGAFGSAEKSKRQTAAELAALLAFSAGKNGDKVGLMMFSDRIELILPPRSGRKHALHLISEMLRFQPRSRGTDIDLALKECARIMKKRGIVFLLSDLIEPEKFSSTLKQLRRRQDVIALEIFDAIETSWDISQPIEFEDAETGEIIHYSGGASALGAELAAAQEAKEKVCRDARCDLIKVQTGTDVLTPVIEFFAARKSHASGTRRS